MGGGAPWLVKLVSVSHGLFWNHKTNTNDLLRSRRIYKERKKLRLRKTNWLEKGITVISGKQTLGFYDQQSLTEHQKKELTEHQVDQRELIMATTLLVSPPFSMLHLSWRRVSLSSRPSLQLSFSGTVSIEFSAKHKIRLFKLCQKNHI